MSGGTLTASLKLRLEPELLAAFEKIARKEERPVSTVMRRALRAYAEKEAKK